MNLGKLQELVMNREAWCATVHRVAKSWTGLSVQTELNWTDGFSSSHIWMWELDHKEGWVPKNWWFWTVVLEKTLVSPLESKETKPIILKGNKAWIFIVRADAEAPILWPPDAKSQLIGKDPNIGKYWGQEEKGATEYEVVGWHHQLNGHEFDETQGDNEGQGSLVCWSSWGCKESDTT